MNQTELEAVASTQVNNWCYTVVAGSGGSAVTRVYLAFIVISVVM